MPTCAQQPQQNPSNSDTNKVCKVYKCSSASFIPPLSTFRGFYLDRLRVAIRGESYGETLSAGCGIFFADYIAKKNANVRISYSTAVLVVSISAE